ncbi:MAG: pirin family protein [Acidobacteria bacterium]|nr:pirin family protein [Acidobacteriota bacterium]
MIQVRRSGERGRTKAGWLDSRHTFSFDRYYDPRFTGFHHLRVINEDRVQPGSGFPTHPHRDMEIITYVLEGALEHRDSLGTGSVIRPGEVQRMSAGTGITHSEFNASKSESVHLLQIWILPERLALTPSYEQRVFPIEDAGGMVLLAAHDGRNGALTIHQDVELHAARLQAGQRAQYSLKPGRHAWLQVARGALSVNDTALATGDGAGVSDEQQLEFAAREDGEMLLFDLAA